MPVGVKLILSVGASILVLAVLALGKVDSGERSQSLWRGGQADPIRRLMAHPDGKLRGGFKLALVALLAAWLAAIWLVA